MDTLIASALVQRQDCYAVPPNYIGPPGRCQRMDAGGWSMLDCRSAFVDYLRSMVYRPSSIVHQSPIEPRFDLA